MLIFTDDADKSGEDNATVNASMRSPTNRLYILYIYRALYVCAFMPFNPSKNEWMKSYHCSLFAFALSLLFFAIEIDRFEDEKFVPMLQRIIYNLCEPFFFMKVAPAHARGRSESNLVPWCQTEEQQEGKMASTDTSRINRWRQNIRRKKLNHTLLPVCQRSVNDTNHAEQDYKMKTIVHGQIFLLGMIWIMRREDEYLSCLSAFNRRNWIIIIIINIIRTEYGCVCMRTFLRGLDCAKHTQV
jgi:hypothetical protein